MSKSPINIRNDYRRVYDPISEWTGHWSFGVGSGALLED